MSSDANRPAAGDLSPETTGLIDDYFTRFRAEALAGGAQGWEDAVVDLRAHVCDRLEGSAGMPEDAVRVLAELGTTETLVAAYLDALPEDDSDGLLAEDGPPAGTGRLLGIPYDLRVAKSSGRLARRVWNPLDRRVLVPKAVGIGWTINLGGLAVRTGVVRPDDEDLPFDAAPPRIVTATLAVPLAALAAFTVLGTVSWSRLPARVPIHWGISGRPDSYEDRGAALVLLSVLALLPVAAAVWVHLRRRPPFTRVVASAMSLSLTTLAVAALVQTLFTLDGGTGAWPLWVGLLCMLALPFALLVGVSRAGRAAERRRDLPGISKKGRL